MIDREVFDIILGTLASLQLYLLVLSDSQGIYIRIQELFLLLIIFLSFGHMIFRQLNRVSDYQSKMLLVVIGFIITAIIIIHIISPPTPIEGFWDIISEGYQIFSYMIMIVMLILSILGTRSNLLNPIN